MKYVGSKNKLIPILQKCIDEVKPEFYLEPFVGGANVIDKISHANKIGIEKLFIVK